MIIGNKKFNKRKKFNKTKNVKKSRKEIRKEKRKLKKSKRNEYYMKKGKSSDHNVKKNVIKDINEKNKRASADINSIDMLTKQHRKENKETQKLKKSMQKQRTKQLLEANESEDKIIKKLEKQLKLNKNKTGSVAKSFAGDGLDYILEMCDSETRKTVANAHKSLSNNDTELDFEDDLGTIVQDKGTHSKQSNNLNITESDDSNFGNNDSDDNDYFDEMQLAEDNMKLIYEESTDENDSVSKNLSDNCSDSNESNYELTLNSNKNTKLKKHEKELTESDTDDDLKLNQKNSNKQVKKSEKDKKGLNSNSDESNSASSLKLNKNKSISGTSMKNNKMNLKDVDDNCSVQSSESEAQNDTNNEWEDIYGRKRDKDGNIISQKNAYVPPALRNEPSDKEKAAIIRLKREMKGLMNRLTVSNMISVSQQMERLYNRGDHSHYNLNNTFCDLINDAIIQSVITPMRIIIDYAILIAILHANIDTEIGAIYLEKIIQKYDQILKCQEDNDNKKLDNVVHIISVLYNLKVIHCVIVHDILRNLITNSLNERNVECVLLMLRTVGPVLRKDDLVLMKMTYEKIHDVINSTHDDIKSKSSRLKYLIDTLTSIKNNNFMKIPNYSPDDVPQMRQVLRNALRPGNQVVQLNISLDDLLNVNKRGKWWIVGSAWTGANDDNKNSKKENTLSTDEDVAVHDEILKLAKKYRMNTETRKRIFVTIMSANDCDDAYERLLRLGLSHGQDREIINILLFCCLIERTFNPYYSVLALKFCDYDRKYKIMLRNAIWDQFQEISKWPLPKIRNLAKFLIQMFLNNGLTLSILKAINLSDMNIPLVRFFRLTLFGILIIEDADIVTRIWSRAGDDIKFKEALRIFIEQFLLRSNIIEGLQPDKRSLLESRGRIALKILQKDRRNGFSL